MTSATGNLSIPPPTGAGCSRSSRGFTLLEMVVTLSIVAILVSFFVVRFVEEAEDEDLHAAVSSLRMAAQKASRMAAAHGEDYYLLLDRQGFWFGQDQPFSDQMLAGAEKTSRDSLSLLLPKEIRLKVRPYGNDTWLLPEAYPWVFPANGLSEPLDVRLEKGKAYVELSFNPMTGRVDRELSWFP